VNLAAMKDKARTFGRWIGRVVGAAAPFIPDPRIKLAAGAAAAVIEAATDTDEDGTDAIVEKGDCA
jgi:hypothetical protein